MTSLTPGTVVTYHGNLTDALGRAYIVAWSLDERLILLDALCPDDSSMLLRDVRPASVTPTGEHRHLCSRCLLPADVPPGSCAEHGASTVPRPQAARPAAAAEGQDR